MLISRWFLASIFSLVFLTVGTTLNFAQTSKENVEQLEQMLVNLNERVLVDYVLHNNTNPLKKLTQNDFFVVGPAGIESREQVIATVGNLDVDSVSVNNAEIRLYGLPTASSAVLAGTLRAKGTLGNQPMPILSYLSVYVRVGDKWRLAARSLTPLMFGPAQN